VPVPSFASVATSVPVPTTRACVNTCVDFSTSNDGTVLRHGDYVMSDWLQDYHMTIETTGGKARIYDTSKNGRNPHLGSPNEKCSPPGPGVGEGGEPGTIGENCNAQGNALIVQDSDELEPDDSPSGGSITMSFDCPLEHLLSVGLLGLDDKETYSFEITDNDDHDIIIPFIGLGRNSFQEAIFSFDNVTSLTFTLPKEGAISSICFCLDRTPCKRSVAAFPTAAAMPPPPPDGTCGSFTSPEPLELGVVTQGSTGFTGGFSGQCGGGPRRRTATTHSEWYTVKGTGDFLTATTCAGTDLDADFNGIITVLTGNCNELECVATESLNTNMVEGCETSNGVTWHSLKGELYSVLVQATKDGESDSFGLLICPGTEICKDSTGHFAGDDLFPAMLFETQPELASAPDDELDEIFGLEFDLKGPITCLLAEVEPLLESDEEKEIYQEVVDKGSDADALEQVHEEMCTAELLTAVQNIGLDPNGEALSEEEMLIGLACEGFMDKFIQVISSGKCLHEIFPAELLTVMKAGDNIDAEVTIPPSFGEETVFIKEVVVPRNNTRAPVAPQAKVTPSGAVAVPLATAADPFSSKIDVCVQALVDIMIPISEYNCFPRTIQVKIFGKKINIFNPACIITIVCCIPEVCKYSPICGLLRTIYKVITHAGNVHCFQGITVKSLWEKVKEKAVAVAFDLLTLPVSELLCEAVKFDIDVMYDAADHLPAEVISLLQDIRKADDTIQTQSWDSSSLSNVRIGYESKNFLQDVWVQASAITLGNLILMQDKYHQILRNPPKNRSGRPVTLIDLQSGNLKPGDWEEYTDAISLLLHELVHVRQYTDAGTCTFLKNYLFDYVINGVVNGFNSAYENNAYERQAYGYERDVVPFKICGQYCVEIRNSDDECRAVCPPFPTPLPIVSFSCPSACPKGKRCCFRFPLPGCPPDSCLVCGRKKIFGFCFS